MFVFYCFRDTYELHTVSHWNWCSAIDAGFRYCISRKDTEVSHEKIWGINNISVALDPHGMLK